jgi:MFS family permease
VFVVLVGLGFGIGTLGRPVLLAEHFGPRDYATLAGLTAIPVMAAMTAGPVTAGVLRTATGDYTAVLLLVAALCLTAAFAVARTGPPRPATSREGSPADVTS